MKPGDLVRWKPPFDTCNWSGEEVGVVVSIHHWKDENDRNDNVGTDIIILWPDGTVRDFFEDELELVVEAG